MSFAIVYLMYVKKAERKNRKQEEVDQTILWLTGYTKAGFKKQLDKKIDIETFFSNAPKFNPKASLITGVVCGVRVENVKEPLMQKIRYLDLLIDELARGKKMEKVLRVENDSDVVATTKTAKKKVKKS